MPRETLCEPQVGCTVEFGELLLSPVEPVRVSTIGGALSGRSVKARITGNGIVLERPPPGDGLVTVMLKPLLFVTASSAPVSWNVIARELRNVAARAAPFTWTVEPLIKPVPFAVTVSGPGVFTPAPVGV